MTDEARAVLHDEVLASLRMVMDPELGENVVDLGLIYGVEIGDDAVAVIEMTTTTRGCPATAYLTDAVQAAAWGVGGIAYADVRLTYAPPWTPEKMSVAAKQRFGVPVGETRLRPVSS